MIKLFLLEKILAMPEHFFLCLRKNQPTFFFVFVFINIIIIIIIQLNKKLIQRNKTIQHN
jgi:hypothetical protein